MISLVLSAKESKEATLCCPAEPGDGPKYPYGTELRLDDETLLKLGVSELPVVGTKFTLMAICEVTDSVSRENKEGREQSLSLQITEMELGTQGVTNDDRARRIYAEKT